MGWLYASPAQRGRGVDGRFTDFQFGRVGAARTTKSALATMTTITKPIQIAQFKATGACMLRNVASLAWVGSTPPPLSGGEA
jgi:hypothetical protein